MDNSKTQNFKVQNYSINKYTENQDKYINKLLKSYLLGKKLNDTNKNKSFEYFKQCLTILNNIKNCGNDNIKIDSTYTEILEETETDCSKYIINDIINKINNPYIEKHFTYEDYCSIIEYIFNIIETGDIKSIKKYKYGDIQLNTSKQIFNKDGLTPLHLAVKVGDTNMLFELLRLGGNIDTTTIQGHTLLEYACLQHDPNMIKFIETHGADMNKH